MPPDTMSKGATTMPTNVPDLTPRELSVLRSITTGRTYDQIADDLTVSVNTVKMYAARLRLKLGCRSRTSMAVWAVKMGRA